ncbi:hypothetical protein Dimus_003579 [Dionaea muscipula]
MEYGPVAVGCYYCMEYGPVAVASIAAVWPNGQLLLSLYAFVVVCFMLLLLLLQPLCCMLLLLLNQLLLSLRIPLIIRVETFNLYAFVAFRPLYGLLLLLLYGAVWPIDNCCFIQPLCFCWVEDFVWAFVAVVVWAVWPIILFFLSCYNIIICTVMFGFDRTEPNLTELFGTKTEPNRI